MNKILSILLLLIITSPLIATDYYTLPDKNDKEKSYLYSPSMKNHFLTKYDIINLNKLILKLKKPKSPISSYIESKLKENTKNLINKYNPETNSNKLISLSLINEINSIIENSKLYSDKEIIKSTNLSKTTLDLIKEKKEPPMLNRLILNEAFKNEINGWITEENNNNKKEIIWKRNIERNEDPYKYIRQVNKEQYLRKTHSISFTVEQDNKKDTWDIPITGKIYSRTTGMFYQLSSIENKEKQNKTIELKIKGNKINNRIYLNLNIKTKNNDINSTINGNIHIKTTKDGVIEKDSFFAFAKKIKLPSVEYIRIKGRVLGTIQNPEINGKLIDANGKEIGYFEGKVALKELLLK